MASLLRRIATPAFAVLMAALAPAMGCDPVPSIQILGPANGSFVFSQGASGQWVNVVGALGAIPLANAQVSLFRDEILVDAGTGAFLNAVPALINPNGTFIGQIWVDRAKVENTIIAHVAYAPAGASLRTRVLRDAVVVHVGTNAATNQGSSRADSAVIRVTDSALNQLESLVGQAFQAQVPDIEAGFADAIANDPQLNDNNTQTSIWGLSIGTVSANVQSSVGHVDIDLAAGPITISGLYRFKTIWWNNCHFDITATSIGALTDQLLNPGVSSPTVLPSQIDVVQSGVTANVYNLDVDFGGICQIIPFTSLIMRPKLINAIQNALADPDGTGPQEPPVTTAVQAALADIQIAGALGPALGMNLNPIMTTADEDATGVTAAASIAPANTTTLCTGATLFPGACPNLGTDTYLVAQTLPTTWGQNIPTPAQTPYDIGFALSPNALNPLFKEVAESGRLSAKMNSMQSCVRTTPTVHGPELDLGCIVDQQQLACDLVGLPCNTPVEVRAYPTTPPVVREGPGPFSSQMPLVMHGLRLEIWTNPALQGSSDTPRMLWRFLASFEAGMDLIIDANAGTLGLGLYLCTIENENGACDPNVNVTTIVSNVPNPDVTPFLVDKVLLSSADGLIGNTLAVALNQAVAEYPLPSFAGYQLQGIVTKNFNGYLSAFFRLVP